MNVVQAIAPVSASVSTAPAVYSAVVKVMAALAKDGIGKDQKNIQQGYNFRGIDDVYNALSGALVDARLCMLPEVMERSCTERSTKSGGVLFYTTVRVRYHIVCADDGSAVDVVTVGEGMDSGDKSSAKAMSCAYKYAALQVFCIPVEGTPDADADSPEVAAPPPALPAPPRATAPSAPISVQRRQTAAEWLDTLAPRLEAVTTWPDLDAILAEPQVIAARERLSGAAHDRLEDLITRACDLLEDQ